MLVGTAALEALRWLAKVAQLGLQGSLPNGPHTTLARPGDAGSLGWGWGTLVSLQVGLFRGGVGLRVLPHSLAPGLQE